MVHRYRCIRDCFTRLRLYKDGQEYDIDTSIGTPSHHFIPLDGGPVLDPPDPERERVEALRREAHDKTLSETEPRTLHEMAKRSSDSVTEAPKPESNDTPPPDMTFDAAMEMTNKSLREALKLKGLSTNGAKPTLARRLMGLSEVE